MFTRLLETDDGTSSFLWHCNWIPKYRLGWFATSNLIGWLCKMVLVVKEQLTAHLTFSLIFPCPAFGHAEPIKKSPLTKQISCGGRKMCGSGSRKSVMKENHVHRSMTLRFFKSRGKKMRVAAVGSARRLCMPRLPICRMNDRAKERFV